MSAGNHCVRCKAHALRLSALSRGTCLAAAKKRHLTTSPARSSTFVRIASPSLIAKRAFEQFQAFLPRRTINADDIESVIYIMEVIPVSIFASNATNLLLFRSMHGLFRSPTSLAGTGLHFDECKCLAVPTNQIYFAEAFAVVASNDLIAVLTQVTIGPEFPRRAFSPIEEFVLMLIVHQCRMVQSSRHAGIKPV